MVESDDDDGNVIGNSCRWTAKSEVIQVILLLSNNHIGFTIKLNRIYPNGSPFWNLDAFLRINRFCAALIGKLSYACMQGTKFVDVQ